MGIRAVSKLKYFAGAIMVLSKHKIFSLSANFVDFDFCRIDKNHYRIEFIFSRDPGGGNASKALKRICELADIKGATLSLLPVSSAGFPLKQVRAWYARHGFVEYHSGMIRLAVNHGK